MRSRTPAHGELPLLLPNAWDVPSALALLDCGFTAIGRRASACVQSRPSQRPPVHPGGESATGQCACHSWSFAVRIGRARRAAGVHRFTALAVRDGHEFPAADPYPDLQARLLRYADQKFSG